MVTPTSKPPKLPIARPTPCRHPGRTRSSAMLSMSGNPGLPPNVNAAGNSQVQFQRRPDTVTVPDAEPWVRKARRPPRWTRATV
ncbi:MAG: hypothetical protein CBARDCOR_2819 [uncultured Caballeronia sp.]|nr:MAG: hypothetical protein CBARDCOR_2819 [uncultured Caballeronia sp.]